MILFNGPNTPFGRMALATALELGLKVENKVINVFDAEFLDAINPLRQIPTLLLDDGRAMFDSRVICGLFLLAATWPRLEPGRGSVGRSNPMVARCGLDGVLGSARHGTAPTEG